jgi:hypothetical protein
MGCLPGFPDLFLFAPSNDGKYLGLGIEMKAPGRKPSAAQLAVHAALAQKGYQVAIIKSLETFRRLIEDYCGDSSGEL